MNKSVLAIITATFLIASSDVIVKFLADHMSMWQLGTIRSVLAVTWIYLLIRIQKISMRALNLKIIFLRSFLLVSLLILYFTALPKLQLAIAAVGLYTAPLFITFFSTIIFKKKVKLRLWIGVSFGLLGVVAILKPGSATFSWYLLLPFISAIIYAIVMLITKFKLEKEEPLHLAFGFNFIMLVFCIIISIYVFFFPFEETAAQEFPFLLAPWKMLHAIDYFWLTLMSILVVGYSVFSSTAYQKGNPSVVGTFDYSYIIFSAIFGATFFNNHLDLISLLGIACVFTAGIIVLEIDKILHQRLLCIAKSFK